MLALKRSVISCYVQYMRVSPAWYQGTFIFPYPTHIAKILIDDQLTILNLS